MGKGNVSVRANECAGACARLETFPHAAIPLFRSIAVCVEGDGELDAGVFCLVPKFPNERPTLWAQGVGRIEARSMYVDPLLGGSSNCSSTRFADNCADAVKVADR